MHHGHDSPCQILLLRVLLLVATYEKAIVLVRVILREQCSSSNSGCHCCYCRWALGSPPSTVLHVYKCGEVSPQEAPVNPDKGVDLARAPGCILQGAGGRCFASWITAALVVVVIEGFGYDVGAGVFVPSNINSVAIRSR